MGPVVQKVDTPLANEMTYFQTHSAIFGREKKCRAYAVQSHLTFV